MGGACPRVNLAPTSAPCRPNRAPSPKPPLPSTPAQPPPGTSSKPPSPASPTRPAKAPAPSSASTPNKPAPAPTPWTCSAKPPAPPPPFAGIPISLKDLFDVAGEITAAGSKALAQAAPATAHATVVQRLLAAGLIPVGRTNMTEFAFSGLGINPHFDTPRSPWNRSGDGGHVPGGSSSGAAVSVADGMAFMGLGTDTGGSCRLPAAFCGIVGYKPTASRVPTQGVLPLSPTLDSVGPLAPSVQCCATIDAILAAEPPPTIPKIALRGLRLAIPGTMVMDGMDATTAAAFNRALNRLDNLGVRVTHLPFPQFDAIAAANAEGGFAAAEAHAWHRALLADQAEIYDPRVRIRIERGNAMGAGALIRLTQARARIIAEMNEATAAYDAVAMPTAPIAPPAIAALTDDADYTRINALVLRNPSLANFLDRCSISIPAHRQGDAPAGFMLMGRNRRRRPPLRHRRRHRNRPQGITNMRPLLLALLLLLAAIPAQAQQVLDAILSRGTLRVGLTGDYKPFSIKDPAGQFEGLDVDMAESLAKALGVKLEIIPTAWPTLMADLLANKYDLAMGGITVTTIRAKTALFSTPVMTSGKTPIARCTDKDKFQTLADIDKPGVRVIYNPGGTNETFAKANASHAQQILFPNNATIFEEIVANHADVMMTDAVETRLQAKLHPELCAIHPDKPFDNSELAYMLPRDLLLQQFVNTWLHLQSLNGERVRAVAKWLG